jgi:hypothetical protein
VIILKYAYFGLDIPEGLEMNNIQMETILPGKLMATSFNYEDNMTVIPKKVYNRMYDKHGSMCIPSDNNKMVSMFYVINIPDNTKLSNNQINDMFPGRLMSVTDLPPDEVLFIPFKEFTCFMIQEENSHFNEIKKKYNVPAEIERKVSINGTPGTIKGAKRDRILVLLDGQPKLEAFHPKNNVEYI